MIRPALIVALTSIACPTRRSATTPVTPAQACCAIIPAPRRLQARPGEFRLDRATRIVLSDTGSAELRKMVNLWAAPLRATSGLPLVVSSERDEKTTPDAIALRLTAGDVAAPSESYQLTVTPRAAVLSAPTHVGLFRGLQTLRQLLPAEIERSVRPPPGSPVRWAIPAVEIEDAPRFPYRGVLLDVARWFYPPEFIKKVIDLLALYKLNTLHLHLTDDQGWRVEIRKYPLLTRIGAWRRETMVGQHFDPYVGDGRPHGGFYTHEEIRDLVAYAAARGITIIPEIEMPGHARAALAAYPDLSCIGGTFEVSARWGVHQDIFCPSERTFGFLEDVLLEVMQLFPSRYIHIGGDEVPKDQWKASPLAQQVIRRERLADEEELQSYFIRRIEAFLLAHNRRLIGWDEILEGGLAPEATVMSWRGMTGGIDAARQGHDVIMTPTDYAYFDYYQGDPAAEPLAIGGFVPLDTVYAFEPVPPALTPAQAKHVLGGQGSLWTEYIPTPAQAEYMLLPRLLALSEVLWSAREARSWGGFITRLAAHFARLDALGVEYRVPEPVGLGWDRQVLENRFRVSMGAPFPGAMIHYTTDGSDPTLHSPRYTGPLRIHLTSSATIVSARAFLSSGRSSPVTRARIARATWHQPVAVRPDDLQPGLSYKYIEGVFRSSDEVAHGTPVRVGNILQVGLRGDERPEEYGLELSGLLCPPSDGLYTFYFSSDDGAKLRIDGALVADRDGPQREGETQGQMALRGGCHALEVRFFQASGAARLQLQVSTPASPKGPVPVTWYQHVGAIR